MEEVFYYNTSQEKEIPVSEMSDLYVRRAFKQMILKEKKRFDNKEKLKVHIRNAMLDLEKAVEEK
tara:strand:- start:244 stop:438 length:195 start_codon:yes stop_codon:yes gene_type:complete